MATRITFHPLIDEPGGTGTTGRRWYKRSDDVNVGLIRVNGEDAYHSEAHRLGDDDWTFVLTSLSDEPLDRREHTRHSAGKRALREMVAAR
jgi:hypothetical protein